LIPTRPFRLRAVLFDFDGTLTRPGALDFEAMRQEVGCPSGTPVLEFVNAIPDPELQAHARRALERWEDEAAARSEADPAAQDVIAYLRGRGAAIGIITRNRRRSVIRALENFSGVGPEDFDVIIDRDVPVSPKPAPDGIAHAARLLGVHVDELMVVGDHALDVTAGHRAGALTVHLDHSPGESAASGVGAGQTDDAVPLPDFTIHTLADLPALARLGLPLLPGKFPNDLLEEYLGELRFVDHSVLIKPGVGEDIAALDVQGEQILVLKSDPITFVTDTIGPYLVMVNANDVATSGARPRWLLATLLFPVGETPSAVLHTLRELRETCEDWGIQLCGGHIEITDAVTRPVLSGMMAGTVDASGLIDKQTMNHGDRVLLSKAVAVEGTSILAREFGNKLIEQGMTAAEVETCRGFLAHIGVLTEARISARREGVTAMHDVTEGGLATALWELSVAGGHRIRVQKDRIPVYPLTAKACGILGLDPLGLIGSGSLLVCCAPAEAAALAEEIERAGVEITDIGEVLEEGQGIEATADGRPTEWPRFEVDELARFLEHGGAPGSR
jgi:hydrogenase expression/formation protein HypE